MVGRLILSFWVSANYQEQTAGFREGIFFFFLGPWSHESLVKMVCHTSWDGLNLLPKILDMVFPQLWYPTSPTSTGKWFSSNQDWMISLFGIVSDVRCFSFLFLWQPKHWCWWFPIQKRFRNFRRGVISFPGGFMNIQMSPKLKPSYFPLNRLLKRDPYNYDGLL